jgi:hypothetical protein
MPKGDSRQVGRLIPRRGHGRQVYQAIRPMICARCGGEIAGGDGFTRSVIDGARMVPVCSGCRPLADYRQNRFGPAGKLPPPANVRSFRERRE